MNIGYLAPGDPLDKKSWSGTYYKLYKSIENRGLSIISLSPTKYSKFQLRLMKVFDRFHYYLTNKKKYNSVHNFISAYFAANYFSKKIKENNIDVIFAPTSSTEFILLKTKLPIIYLSDTSFNQVKDYYSFNDVKNYDGWWSNLSSFSIKESNLIEKKAIAKATAIIYPSKWAADYAVDYYKADPNKIHLIKFGANIDTPEKITFEKDYKSTITFLFLGVDWVRKGGDIALKTIEKLKLLGYNVKLLVCGCIPPVNSDILEVIPFLDKNKPVDNLRLQKLLTESHFLFLPTRAEAYGIVFCEAAAYGLPIITTDTGGVTSIVENGVNGYALPFEAGVDDYVNVIQTLLNNPEKIKLISKSARLKYETELNWDVFGEKFEQLIDNLYREIFNQKLL